MINKIIANKIMNLIDTLIDTCMSIIVFAAIAMITFIIAVSINMFSWPRVLGKIVITCIINVILLLKPLSPSENTLIVQVGQETIGQFIVPLVTTVAMIAINKGILRLYGFPELTSAQRTGTLVASWIGTIALVFTISTSVEYQIELISPLLAIWIPGVTGILKGEKRKHFNIAEMTQLCAALILAGLFVYLTVYKSRELISAGLLISGAIVHSYPLSYPLSWKIDKPEC